MNNLFHIVYEDDALLVINKPAGLVCHPTKGDVYSSLISRVRLYLDGAARQVVEGGAQPQIRSPKSEIRTKSEAQGGISQSAIRVSDFGLLSDFENSDFGFQTTYHLINRLDRETSGLVLVAKNSTAALELRRLWENGAVTKRYLAIVHGCVPLLAGMIDAPLGRDDQSVVAIKNKVRADGAPARTEFELLKTFERDGRRFSLLAVRPATGRKHQIRIHLAHYGHAIVGDKIYGGDERCYLDFVQSRLSDEQRACLMLPNHALHAQSVSFAWRGREMVFQAEPEPGFTRFLGRSGRRSEQEGTGRTEGERIR